MTMCYFSIVVQFKHARHTCMTIVVMSFAVSHMSVFKMPCQVKRISTFKCSAAHQFQNSGPIRRPRRWGTHCRLLFTVASWHGNCFIWWQHGGGGILRCVSCFRCKNVFLCEQALRMFCPSSLPANHVTENYEILTWESILIIRYLLNQ